MKYREMKEAFKAELDFLQMITEYESGLEQLHNMKEAAGKTSTVSRSSATMTAGACGDNLTDGLY